MMTCVRVVFASELPLCDCCEEPWCPEHNEHYGTCACIGPHNAEELGFELQELAGVLFACKRNNPAF